jgi:hypothetical protein
VGLFKTKPKPEPIPMEERPIVYARWPVCKHRADDEDCGCHSWDLRFWKQDNPDLLPTRRGSTKRNLVAIESWQKHNETDVTVLALDRSTWVADARIPPNQRKWAYSDEGRIVYQVWLVVTRVDEAEWDDEPQYEAALRMGRKGEVLQFDEDDPAAMTY